MNAQKVLWQLFGAIFAGITVGVLIGYRTNAWVGILTGTLLAYLTADWHYVWVTSRQLWKEFRDGFLLGLGVVQQREVRSRFGRYGEYAAELIVYVPFATLVIGALAVGFSVSGTIAWTFGFPHLGPAHDVLERTVDVLWVPLAFGLFIPGIIAALCFSLLTWLINKGKQKPCTVLPIFRIALPWLGNEITAKLAKLFPSKKEKVADTQAEADVFVNVTRIHWVDEKGRYLDWSRFTTLVIPFAIFVLLSPLIAIAAAVGIVSIVILTLDTLITALLALATSRSTIAGYCTAAGITMWFLLYPEALVTAMQFARLLGFAVLGGLTGVVLYKLKEWLLALEPPPKPATASA